MKKEYFLFSLKYMFIIFIISYLLFLILYIRMVGVLSWQLSNYIKVGQKRYVNVYVYVRVLKCFNYLMNNIWKMGRNIVNYSLISMKRDKNS